jgi:hypothetical protein
MNVPASLAAKAVVDIDTDELGSIALTDDPKVTITYQGKRIPPKRAHASFRGTYSGPSTSTSSGAPRRSRRSRRYSSRKAAETFEVVRRCNVAPACD